MVLILKTRPMIFIGYSKKTKKTKPSKKPHKNKTKQNKKLKTSKILLLCRSYGSSQSPLESYMKHGRPTILISTFFPPVPKHWSVIFKCYQRTMKSTNSKLFRTNLCFKINFKNLALSAKQSGLLVRTRSGFS